MLEHNTITLNDGDKEAINTVLGSSEFSTPEEVVHAGLTLLKERQAKIQALKQALKEGEESGYIDDFDWKEHRRKLNAEYVKND